MDNVDGKPIEFVCKDGKAVVYAIQEKALALKARSRFVPPPPPDEAPPSLQEEVPRDDDMDDDLPPPPSYPPPPDPPAADASEAKAEPKTMTNAGKGLSAGARETMHEAKLKGKRVQLAASDMGLQVFDDKTGAVLETHMYQLLDGWSVSSKGLTVTPKGSAKSIVFVCESGKAVVLEMQEKALALKAATKKRLGEVKRPEGAAEEEEAEEGGSGGRAMVTSSDTGFTFTVDEGETEIVAGGKTAGEAEEIKLDGSELDDAKRAELTKDVGTFPASKSVQVATAAPDAAATVDRLSVSTACRPAVPSTRLYRLLGQSGAAHELFAPATDTSEDDAGSESDSELAAEEGVEAEVGATGQPAQAAADASPPTQEPALGPARESAPAMTLAPAPAPSRFRRRSVQLLVPAGITETMHEAKLKGKKVLLQVTSSWLTAAIPI